MFSNRELTGRLFDSQIVNLTLNLRAINKEHIIGSSSIDYLGKTYDAQTVDQALAVLEAVAQKNSLLVKNCTAESSLDELLGIGDVKNIEITATLKCWNLLDQISTL